MAATTQDHVFWATAEATRPLPREIDWECPCLNSMKKSPCGSIFKGAFECYVNSDPDTKAAACSPHFSAFRTCLDTHQDYFAKIAKEE
ncbi:MAG: hypothetical protein Q8P67_02755 [archaeon]|nr:hypothetical protein [archaeon]